MNVKTQVHTYSLKKGEIFLFLKRIILIKRINIKNAYINGKLIMGKHVKKWN